MERGHGDLVNFAIIDRTGSISVDDLCVYAAAQQIQLRDHFSKHFDAGQQDNVFVLHGEEGFRGDPNLIIVSIEHAPKNADDGTLGEHAVDVCHVYKDLTDRYGDMWQTVASHEVLEARADRFLCTCVELADGTIVDFEICDRVEADRYPVQTLIEINGKPAPPVLLSNFNTPACFSPLGVPDEVYDHMELSKAPNEVRNGGYAQSYKPGEGWTQRGQMRGYRAHLHNLGVTRNARRQVSRAQQAKAVHPRGSFLAALATGKPIRRRSWVGFGYSTRRWINVGDIAFGAERSRNDLIEINTGNKITLSADEYLAFDWESM